MTHDIQYYILAILFGIMFKIYDDMIDNDLYECTEFLKKNKKYIVEFLKLACCGLLVYISSKYPMCVIIFAIINIIQYVIEYIYYGKTAFDLPYEYSGLLCLIIYILYLFLYNVHDISSLILNNILIISSCIILYII